MLPPIPSEKYNSSVRSEECGVMVRRTSHIAPRIELFKESYDEAVHKNPYEI